MDQHSDPENLGAYHKDVLARLDRLDALVDQLDALVARQDTRVWDVCYTGFDTASPEGWEPFAVTSPSPGVTFVWWRRPC